MALNDTQKQNMPLHSTWIDLACCRVVHMVNIEDHCYSTGTHIMVYLIPTAIKAALWGPMKLMGDFMYAWLECVKHCYQELMEAGMS